MSLTKETRQTLIGTVGLTTVMIMALSEGFNGRVTAAYIVAIVALVSPQALETLPLGRSGGR